MGCSISRAHKAWSRSLLFTDFRGTDPPTVFSTFDWDQLANNMAGKNALKSIHLPSLKAFFF